MEQETNITLFQPYKIVLVCSPWILGQAAFTLTSTAPCLCQYSSWCKRVSGQEEVSGHFCHTSKAPGDSRELKASWTSTLQPSAPWRLNQAYKIAFANKRLKMNKGRRAVLPVPAQTRPAHMHTRAYAAAIHGLLQKLTKSQERPHPVPTHKCQNHEHSKSSGNPGLATQKTLSQEVLVLCFPGELHAPTHKYTLGL